ncbi:MAG: aspartate/glutamate racemase family protein [Acidimicrobiales bacterium]
MTKARGLFGYAPKNASGAEHFDSAPTRRIGLLGGLSWESTIRYYTILNTLSISENGPWSQPAVIIDSLDFSQIVRFRRAGDWVALGRVLADSAQRLEAGGATVLGIGANTMHRNYDDVASAVSIPVIDVRDAMVQEVKARGATAMTLLGTRYLIESSFYSSHLERSGVHVVKPDANQVDELQAMIDNVMARGTVGHEARERFVEIVSDCRSRGGQVVGLCSSEFTLLVDDENPPWPVVDSIGVHVKALLDHHD